MRPSRSPLQRDHSSLAIPTVAVRRWLFPGRLLRCCGSVCAWSWIAAHHPQRTYRAIARAHEAYTFFATTRRTVSLQSVGNLWAPTASDIEGPTDLDWVSLCFETEISRCALDSCVAQQRSNCLQIASAFSKCSGASAACRKSSKNSKAKIAKMLCKILRNLSKCWREGREK